MTVTNNTPTYCSRTKRQCTRYLAKIGICFKSFDWLALSTCYHKVSPKTPEKRRIALIAFVLENDKPGQIIIACCNRSAVSKQNI